VRRVTAALVGTGVGTALLVVVKSQLVPGTAGAASGQPAPTVAHPATAMQPPVNGLGTGLSRAQPARSQSRAGAASPAVPLVDGDYLGVETTNPFGPVQVRITVSGGRLTDVIAMELPTAAARGIEIGMRVTPILRQQAIDRQSADVDTVSGATYTCDGYRQSLQSALDSAHARR
jgi:uncharacterized protein with FMN-binding domain